MSTATAESADGQKQPGALRVGIQKVGSFMSGMIMPVIPALIAWGILTAVLVNIGEWTTGWAPAEALDTAIFPMIHYLLPILIAVQGGKMVYDMRGAVVGGIAALGVIAGSDHIVDQFNAGLPEAEQLEYVHMFIGAMILGPLAAWIMKKLDGLWEGKIRAGFEMLVNMFSAGILGFFLVIGGFFGLAPVINGLMNVLETVVGFLVDHGLLPLASVIIEPAKVFFLNNAINHGVLTPLGIQEASGEAGQSILFLLEANPGVGLGLLLAFSVFGVGAARATAPGAAIIVFLGGIHEVYFPYVLMKPALLLAVIAGGATGVTTNMLLEVGLQGPAAPGSVIAVYLQSLGGGMGNIIGVTLSWILAAAVTFAVAALILLKDRKKDLAGEDGFTSAVAKTAAAKGKSSSHLSDLADAAAVPAQTEKVIQKVIFACDAGMGSSAMGASVLRKKFKAAGIEGVEVTNKAIAALPGDTDLVITQESLTDRARGQEPEAIHVSVDSFMDAPEYDEVVELVQNSRQPAAVGAGEGSASSAAPAVSAASAEADAAPVPETADSGILTLSQVRIHSGSATQEEALAEAAQILVDSGAVTEDYLQAMKDREATVSTFMGNGLAIPHGTNDAKDAVKASALSVVRYDGGVDWAGDQADFVIGIAGVGDEHLEILSRIAVLFAEENEVAQLRAASSEEELLQMLSAVNDG
ncbi:PTS mannitol transporter subunit IICBA [Nesterenkonia lacusekhoensis]|uniref:Mannitol-specific phosphotransferase enzyme IIA component n=1 Tax=Nesterenkonia lacusekhoensis TaxID=150832 RepID=A0ABS4T1T1_9MICC|nr:PTS mannitol transporter subunit IICBA [Nesterenkonia lacusekhoensis]MBP2317216.1 PTS system mannitol-specific IIC component [Nesterenkonia lacusekhoensis]